MREDEKFAERLVIGVEKLRGAAMRLTRNKTLTEDLIGDVVLKAYNRRNFYQPQEGVDFEAWLYTIMHRTWLDCEKKRKRMPLVDLKKALHHTDKAPTPDSEVQCEYYLNQVAQLEEPWRSPLVHRIQGYSYKQIGELLGIPSARVKRYLHEGRDQIKNRVRIRDVQN